jgi:hypothetical protein
MALKINVGGGKTKKSASKRSTSTSTTRSKTRTAARKTATKRTASKPATTKRQSTRTTDRRSSKTDLSQTQLKKLLGPLERHATKRDKLRAELNEEIELTQEALFEALDANVPVGLVQKAANVSRQHIYKLLGERQNGSGPKSRAKAAAKTATKPAKSPKASNGRKKPGRKTTGSQKKISRPKIRS